MSESADDGGPGRREVAYRLFASEFEDATLEHSESDRERAPNYVITPTGGRVNRLFVVGVLTEVEPVSDEVRRARVVDPSGAFVLYAGQYQPDERAFIERADPPAFVAVTGKARTFTPEDGDRVFSSVRPESISEVDAETRDRWTLDAVERTLERVDVMGTALTLEARGADLQAALEDRGVEEGLAAGIPLAIDHYGTTATYLADVRRLAIDATRLVAGDLDEITPLEVDPDATGPETPADLVEGAVESPATAGDAGESETESPSPSRSAEAESTSEETAAADNDAEAVDPGDFDTGDFEMDEAERESIEAEYGTEFQAGSEVDEPGQADIDTPGDPPTSDDADEDAEPPVVEETVETPDEGAEDLVDVAVDVMEDLDSGDGAERAAVVETVIERSGAAQTAVEDAIQDALMDGRCYEPDDGTLKPI